MSTTLESISSAIQQKANTVNTVVRLKAQHAQVASTLKQLSEGKASLAVQLASPAASALFTVEEHAVLAAEVAALPSEPVAS